MTGPAHTRAISQYRTNITYILILPTDEKLFFSSILLLAVCLTSVGQIEFTPERKLRYAEQIIESYYVDRIDTAKVVTEAIVAMLKTLDPHSTYSSPEETRELTEPLDGNFSGIGIRFQMNTILSMSSSQWPAAPRKR